MGASRKVATLVARLEEATAARKGASISTPEQREAAFTLTSNLALSRRAIDRIYVSYRGDASGRGVRFEVICDGRHAAGGRTWRQGNDRTELRWPEDMKDPLEARTQITCSSRPPRPAQSRLSPCGCVWKASRWRAPGPTSPRQLQGRVQGSPFLRYVMTSVALTLINVTLMIFSRRWPLMPSRACAGRARALLRHPAGDDDDSRPVTMIPAFLVSAGWVVQLARAAVDLFALRVGVFIFLLRQFFKNIPLDWKTPRASMAADSCAFIGT